MSLLAVDTKAEMFAPFLELPVEIRLKIWKIIAHFPRDVQVSAPSVPCRDLEGHWDEDDESEAKSINKIINPVALERFKSSTPVPTILHISHEARVEGLHFYTEAFRKRHTTGGTRIYINPAADTLLIRISDQCTSWYCWAQRRFVHVPGMREPIMSSPWADFGLKAQVAMAHPQRVGCCAQREIMVLVKADVEENEDVKEYVAKLGFWGKVAETIEFMELRDWEFIWDLLFDELDDLRRIRDGGN